MDNYPFYEDEDNHFAPKFSFGQKIDSKKVASSIKQFQSINYKYLQIGTTKYHFAQNCFDNKDIVAYFKFVKLLSEKTFDDLLSEKDPQWHLNKSEYRGNLKAAINSSIGDGKQLRVEQTPDFYHFALYTSKEKADRAKNIKSPRVYFFIGDDATIYPLFYDPYHEINP